MKNVIIGFIGTQLDAGYSSQRRWKKWRPTISLAQQEEITPDEMELFYSAKKYEDLARIIKKDIHTINPDIKVTINYLPIEDVWDFEQVYSALYDWSRGYKFDIGNTDYKIHITTGSHVAQICLFLLAESRQIPAKLLQTIPPKNIDNKAKLEIIDLDLSKYDQIAKRFDTAKKDAISFLKNGINTKNIKFNSLIEEIENVARKSNAPILLTGATGAGKSFLARKIAKLKQSLNLITGEFVEANCATLKGDGAMSALFGHKKGSFTGALGERAGLLKKANNGILFLDEIGELGADEQAMLLKAIEEKVFYPLGSDNLEKSEFQLIAGTNKNLKEEIKRGLFRQDLYSRINLWTYELPALCERLEDIEPNIEYFLSLHSKENGLNARFHPEAKDRYLKFAKSKNAKWSGNFRDLSASITRLCILSDSGRISIDNVDLEIKKLEDLWGDNNTTENSDIINIDLGDIDEFDRLQLLSILPIIKKCRSLSEAGRILFSKSRAGKLNPNDADRLKKYLAKYGLDFAKLKEDF